MAGRRTERLSACHAFGASPALSRQDRWHWTLSWPVSCWVVGGRRPVEAGRRIHLHDVGQLLPAAARNVPDLGGHFAVRGVCDVKRLVEERVLA